MRAHGHPSAPRNPTRPPPPPQDVPRPNEVPQLWSPMTGAELVQHVSNLVVDMRDKAEDQMLTMPLLRFAAALGCAILLWAVVARLWHSLRRVIFV